MSAWPDTPTEVVRWRQADLVVVWVDALEPQLRRRRLEVSAAVVGAGLTHHPPGDHLTGEADSHCILTARKSELARRLESSTHGSEDQPGAQGPDSSQLSGRTLKRSQKRRVRQRRVIPPPRPVAAKRFARLKMVAVKG
jgi:hypothetical protein